MEERERCYSFILSRTPHETKYQKQIVKKDDSFLCESTLTTCKLRVLTLGWIVRVRVCVMFIYITYFITWFIRVSNFPYSTYKASSNRCTVNSTSDSYFKGISANIELQVYNTNCCSPYAKIAVENIT
jgi:hypothetical protein